MGLFDFFKRGSNEEEYDEDFVEERPQRFPNVGWYCDFCGEHLNEQEGFDDHKYVWKCTECGRKSSISADNIVE